MNTLTIRKGSNVVVVNEQCGKFFARLYVNCHNGVTTGDSTLSVWVGKTLVGARKWADKVLEGR